MLSRTDSSAMIPSVLRSSGSSRSGGGWRRAACATGRARRRCGPARLRHLGAEEEAGGLGAAGPEEAREAHHLAAPERQVEGRDVSGFPESFEVRDLAPLGGGGSVPVRRARLFGGLAELAPEHRLDQRHPREVRGRPGADEPAVAQHRDPVGDGIDLIEEVGDEDDAQPLCGQAAHDAEQDLDLVRVEARRRLVEDQHPGRQVDGPGDGDEVLHGDRVVAERRAGIDREVEPGEDGGARRRISPWRTRPNRVGSRFRKRFCATVRFGSRFTSW